MTTRYTRDHEWIRLEGDVATVGISEYAQARLANTDPRRERRANFEGASDERIADKARRFKPRKFAMPPSADLK